MDDKTVAQQTQASHEVRLTYEQLGTISGVVIVGLTCLVALVGCLWLTSWGDTIVARVNSVVGSIALLLGINSGGVGVSWVKGFFDRKTGSKEDASP
jgi:hypothetical protein